MALQPFAGALAGGGRCDGLDAALVQPLVGRDLDVSTDP